VDNQIITVINSTGGALIVGLGFTWISTHQLGTRVADVVARLSALETKVDHRLDLRMAKFYEFDNRVSRIEDHLNIPPK
jgi:hypothetical protein